MLHSMEVLYGCETWSVLVREEQIKKIRERGAERNKMT